MRQVVHRLSLRHRWRLAAPSLLAACGGGAPHRGESRHHAADRPPTTPARRPRTPTCRRSAQSVGEHQGEQSLRRLPQRGRPGAEFARNDDVNLAYDGRQRSREPRRSPISRAWSIKVAAATTAGSPLRIGLRRHCSPPGSATGPACVGGGGTQIQLQAPPIKEVGSSKSFPDDSAALRSHHLAARAWRRAIACAAIRPTAPRRSRRSSRATNVDEAYAAARSKINLDNPAGDASRASWCACATSPTTAGPPQLRQRRRSAMHAADPGLRGRHRRSRRSIRACTISKALTLYDGTVAAAATATTPT